MDSPTLGSVKNANHLNLYAFDTIIQPIHEKIKDQVFTDIKTLDELGITVKQIADKLQTIFLKTEQLFENAALNWDSLESAVAIIEGKFKVSLVGGSIINCPLSMRRVCGRGIKKYSIENIKTRETMIVSDLLPHVIRDHEFFFKEGSRLRLDPTLVCRLLELDPGVDYARVKIQNIWALHQYESPCPKAHIKMLEKSSSKPHILNEKTKAYVINSSEIEHDKSPFEELEAHIREEMLFRFEDDFESTLNTQDKEETFLHLLTSIRNTKLKPTEIEGSTLDLNQIFPLIKGVTILKPDQKLFVDLDRNDELVME